MAKPTKNATPICIGLSILATVGILIGIFAHSAIITMFALLPTIIYEIYRTEGRSTKWASWAILGVFVVEIIFIIFNISFDLAQFLEINEKYISGYEIPLGDIKLFGPALMAILSLILITKTRGKYTKWLAIIILISSFAIILSLDSTLFERYIKIAIEEGLNNIN